MLFLWLGLAGCAALWEKPFPFDFSRFQDRPLPEISLEEKNPVSPNELLRMASGFFHFGWKFFSNCLESDNDLATFLPRRPATTRNLSATSTKKAPNHIQLSA